VVRRSPLSPGRPGQACGERGRTSDSVQTAPSPWPLRGVRARRRRSEGVVQAPQTSASAGSERSEGGPRRYELGNRTGSPISREWVKQDRPSRPLAVRNGGGLHRVHDPDSGTSVPWQRWVELRVERFTLDSRTQREAGLGSGCGRGAHGSHGRWTVTVVPLPSSLAMVNVPPCCSTICLEPARPSPVPAMRPTTFAPR
jgi:hypothetical protein